jgi:Planctomycete cytochrome C/WD domain, G-beta repeat
MPVRPSIFATSAACILAAAAPARPDDGLSSASPSYDRDVRPIFRKRCAGCHNTDRPRGELDLTSYAGVQAGGAGGKAVVARAPEESPVYTFAAHLEEPHMPPNAARLPQRELDVLRRWIEGGLAESAGNVSAGPNGGPVSEPAVSPAGGLIPPVAPPRASAVTALAVSRSRPLAAVSGHRQILVYDLASKKLLGALAFPEGDVFTLRFSADDRTLLAAGGIGAESGKVVLFDAASWRRLATLGDELDSVLAADLSPDGTHVVLGGPSRLVKILERPRGDVLHTFRKPTEWVTAAAFSPDGLLAAAGDRFGGLFLWEARSGKPFLTLRGHTRAVTAIAWLAAKDAMVTAGEDGRIECSDLHTGQSIVGWDAHAGGVLSIDVGPSGRIASAGRDRQVKVWAPDGRLVADRGPTSEIATRVAWMVDGRGLVSGDLAGELRVWSAEGPSYAILPTPVSAGPAPLAMVEPDLAPARPKAVRPSPVTSRTVPDSPAVGDDLDVALDAARAAATAAERALAELSRVAQARTRVRGKPLAEPPARLSRRRALDAARNGLAALRLALEADPSNPSLKRAIEEAEHAVTQLEHELARDRPPSAR